MRLGRLHNPFPVLLELLIVNFGDILFHIFSCATPLSSFLFRPCFLILLFSRTLEEENTRALFNKSERLAALPRNPYSPCVHIGKSAMVFIAT